MVEPLSSDNVSSKYIVFQTHFDRLVNVVKSDVKHFARQAFSRNLINDKDLIAAENSMLSEEHRTAIFLHQIMNKINENDYHFDTFIAILRNFPSIGHLVDDLTKKFSPMIG